MKEIKEVFIPIEKITGKIYFIRGQKVIIDRDLAEFYDVEQRFLSKLLEGT